MSELKKNSSVGRLDSQKWGRCEGEKNIWIYVQHISCRFSGGLTHLTPTPKVFYLQQAVCVPGRVNWFASARESKELRTRVSFPSFPSRKACSLRQAIVLSSWMRSLVKSTVFKNSAVGGSSLKSWERRWHCSDVVLWRWQSVSGLRRFQLDLERRRKRCL